MSNPSTIPKVVLTPGGRSSPGVVTIPIPPRADGPLVSCLMVSRGATAPALFAIDCYRRQTWPNRELVIVCADPFAKLAGAVAALADPTIRYVSVKPATLGELRNISVAHARGSLLCQWDDDDLCTPDRIALQVAALEADSSAAAFLMRWTIWWPARRRLAVSGRRIWEASMLVRRSALPIYPALARGEDTEVVRMIRLHHPVTLIDQPACYCYVAHGRNASGGAHFEKLFETVTEAFEFGHYDVALGMLGRTMPMIDYASTLGVDED